MSESPVAGPMPNETARVEAFSDGVFAIAITRLILEIKVPHEQSGETLRAQLQHFVLSVSNSLKLMLPSSCLSV